jgi:hypothetical protein
MLRHRARRNNHPTNNHHIRRNCSSCQQLRNLLFFIGFIPGNNPNRANQGDVLGSCFQLPQTAAER